MAEGRTGAGREVAEPRAAATRIVRALQEAGYVAYLAGGCVRDMLLGLEPKDYDVATDATPEQVGRLFRRARPVGEAFGVMLVRLMGREIEVATFRSEAGYTDGRRPDAVTFTDARHDAERRDFTINGMFLDPVTEQVHDWVGGRTDLKARRIRAIGDPEARFTEDYLRMLRAVRFAAGYDFALEPATRAAIERHADKLARISRERIGMEVHAMLTGPRPARAAALLAEVGLDAPTLDEPHLDRPVRILERLQSVAHATRLAAWALDRHLPETPQAAAAADGCAAGRSELARIVASIKPLPIVARWRRALTLSNAERDAMEHLLMALPDALRWSALSVAGRKRLAGRDDWPEVFALLRALMPASAGAGQPDAIESIARQVDALERDGVGLNPAPLITGDDLVAAGHKPGPAFRRVLDAVYDAQLEARITDRAQALALADAVFADRPE